MKKLFILSLAFIFISPLSSLAQESLLDLNRDANLTSENDELETRNVSIPRRKEDRIDILDARSMEITDVLDLIERRSQLTIISDDNIQGELTLYLKDVNARDVLLVVLDMVDLAFSENNGIIKVMTRDEYRALYSRTYKQETQSEIIPLEYVEFDDVKEKLNEMVSAKGKVFFDEYSENIVLLDIPDNIDAIKTYLEEIDVQLENEKFVLKYVSVDDVVGKIEPILTENLGTLKTDSDSNSIVVNDIRSRLDKIGRLIQRTDEEAKQIVVKVKALQITLSDEHETGVDWEAIVSDYQSVEFNGFSNSVDNFETKKLGLGSVSDEDLPILLEALEAVGIINPVLDSSLKTDALRKAKVKLKTEDLNLGLLDTEIDSDGYVEEEYRLQLSIREKEDLFIVKINPQVMIENSGLNKMLLRDAAQDIESEVKIKKGETIVVGGMFKETKVESIKKIPFLAEIPFLGFAFRMQKEQLRNTEVIIFLTPEVSKKQ